MLIMSRLQQAGNTKGGSITVQLTSCLTGLELAVRQMPFFCFNLQKRIIQTSQSGGQWYSDTFPFSIFPAAACLMPLAKIIQKCTASTIS